mgnify:CR=1 FL=1
MTHDTGYDSSDDTDDDGTQLVMGIDTHLNLHPCTPISHLQVDVSVIREDIDAIYGNQAAMREDLDNMYSDLTSIGEDVREMLQHIILLLTNKN